MDEDEIRKSAALEQRHWWYAERRALVRRLTRSWPTGRALDVGCGGGGNLSVLRDHGWTATGLEHSPAAAGLAASRGLTVVRGDARRLPFADGAFDLVMSTDAWEHIDDDAAVAAEAARVLRPGGRLLVAVPCSMKLWSGHDVALGHLRRYERAELVDLVTGSGFRLDSVRSWNVVLRPVVRARRRHNTSESEMDHVAAPLNAALRATVALERVLPLGHLPGVSLVVTATRR